MTIPLAPPTQPRRFLRFGNLWARTMRIYDEFADDRIPTVAAAITFFFLLALFPAIASVVSLYGMFADRATIAKDLQLVSGFLPGGAMMVLDSELHRLIRQKPETLNLTFLTSFVIAVWSASGGVKALIEGLDVAYEAKETRSFVRLTINALLFTIAAILFAVVGINLGVVVPRAAQSLEDAGHFSMGLSILSWPISVLVCTVILSVVYRYGPDRPGAKWRWFTWGGAIASVLWLLGTSGFTWYAQNFGSYDRVYGSLGAAVGFLTWIWLSLVILLLGAEINCQLEREATGRRKPKPPISIPHP